MKEHLINSIFGGYDGWQFAGFVLWSLVGAFIMINLQSHTRDPKSPRTPNCFSWSFWLLDNGRRVVFNLVLIIAVIRFSKDITGHEINDFWAFAIGLSSDGLAILVNKFKLVNLIGTFTGTSQSTQPKEDPK